MQTAEKLLHDLGLKPAEISILTQEATGTPVSKSNLSRWFHEDRKSATGLNFLYYFLLNHQRQKEEKTNEHRMASAQLSLLKARDMLMACREEGDYEKRLKLRATIEKIETALQEFEETKKI